MRKIILALILAVTATGVASAQKFLEYGITAGINMPNYKVSHQIESKENLGWQAGLTLRINTPIVAIQPELLYVRQGVDLQWMQNGQMQDLHVKSNSLNLPVLASFTLLKILRLNVGPVFSLLNSCKYKNDGHKYDLGRLQPTLGYAVGAAVKLGPMVVDARFNGNFADKKAEANHAGLNVDLKTYSFAISLGYVF